MVIIVWVVWARGLPGYKGVRRSICKHVVYYTFKTYEKHLLFLNCEIRNVL